MSIQPSPISNKQIFASLTSIEQKEVAKLLLRLNMLSSEIGNKRDETLRIKIRDIRVTLKEYGFDIDKLKCGIVIVDTQNDFCESVLSDGTNPGLPVTGSNGIFKHINYIRPSFTDDKVFITEDSHTKKDITFAKTHDSEPFMIIDITYTVENGTIIQKNMVWPPHCIEGTEGFKLSPLLKYTGNERRYKKGFGLRESYSAVKNTLGEDATKLLEDLKTEGFEFIFIVGLARDYCVGNTALDLSLEGFCVFILEDCTAFVAEDSNKTMSEKFANPETRVYSMNSTDIIDVETIKEQLIKQHLTLSTTELKKEEDDIDYTNIKIGGSVMHSEYN